MSAMCTSFAIQVELRLSKPETRFERDFFFPRNVASTLLLQESGTDALAQSSPTFSFGSFSWSVVARPQLPPPMATAWNSSINKKNNDSAAIAVKLVRKFRSNSQALLCRLRYTSSVGVGTKKEMKT